MTVAKRSVLSQRHTNLLGFAWFQMNLPGNQTHAAISIHFSSPKTFPNGPKPQSHTGPWGFGVSTLANSFQSHSSNAVLGSLCHGHLPRGSLRPDARGTGVPGPWYQFREHLRVDSRQEGAGECRRGVFRVSLSWNWGLKGHRPGWWI